MSEHDDVMCQVRESFSGLHMDTPVESVFARSRARRRRQLSVLTGAAAATAGAATALTLTLSATAPARPGSPPPARPRPASLAAFSVASGPGSSTTLVLRRGAQLDPSALRLALAQHGIPAVVTVGAFCRTTPGVAGFGQVAQPSALPNGSDVIVISGSAMPPGTRLSIGIFPSNVRMLLITDGPLSCTSTSDQPAAHGTPPPGTAIHN